MPEPERIGFELPHEQAPSVDAPVATSAPDPEVVGPKLHHRKPAAPEAVPAAPEGVPAAPEGVPAAPEGVPPAPKRKIGFKSSEEPAAIPDAPETPPAGGRRKIGFMSSEEPASAVDAPSGTHDQPLPSGDSPPSGGVISDMPPAREVPSSHRPGSGTAQSPVNRPAHAVGSSVPESPRTGVGDAPVAELPTKGSVVSRVEPEIPAASKSEAPLSPEAEARLADEQAVQSARERRIADETRVKELNDKFEELETMHKELGKRPRDYVEEAFDQTKKELRDAKSDLRKSQRAEAEAEAAERIGLRRRRDIDPAAALHDPEVKLQAETELKDRQTRVEQNNELIKANEPAVAKAQAKVAAREKEFDATRPGSNEGPQSRELTRARAAAKKRLDSARRNLEAVQKRTAAAEAANQKHYQRMQDLDRVLHPENYPELTGAKGDFGELQGDKFMGENGYEFKGSSKKPEFPAKPSDKGLDGVYEKTSAAPGEPKHVVGEAKYDQAKLRPGQEKVDWVNDRLDRAVGRTHANKMRSEGYEYWVLKYDAKLQRVKLTKLWEWRPTGRVGPGGTPLGTVHYFPPP